MLNKSKKMRKKKKRKKLKRINKRRKRIRTPQLLMVLQLKPTKRASP